jgi:hypothetical protein
MAITAWKETHKFYLALLNIFAEKLPPEKWVYVRVGSMFGIRTRYPLIYDRGVGTRDSSVGAVWNYPSW